MDYEKDFRSMSVSFPPLLLSAENSFTLLPNFLDDQLVSFVFRLIYAVCIKFIIIVALFRYTG